MRNPYIKEKVAALLESRWGRILDAGKAIKDPGVRYSVAVLLENQRQYMARSGMLNEVGTTADVTGLPTTIFPIIRRVYPNLIANEIVGVQSMTSPSGVVFYMQYYSPTGKSIYGQTKTSDNELLVWNQTTGRFAFDESYASTFTRNEYHAPVSGSATFSGSTIKVTPEGGGTGSSKLGGDAKLAAMVVDGTITTTSNIIVLRCFYRGQLVAQNSYAYSGGTYTGTATGTYTPGTGWTEAPVFTNTAFAFAGTESEGDLEIYADYNYQAITGRKTAQGGADKGSAYNNEGDADYGFANSGNFPIPEMELKIFQDQVKATKKALKTSWTIEDEQDMKAFHNIDVEKELVTVMGSEMALEIDREIVTDIRDNVGFEMVHDWSTANVPGIPSATHPGLGMVYDDLAKALCSTLMAASFEVHKRTMRGAANWAIMSPVLAARFTALNTFKYSGSPGENTGNLGMKTEGTVNGMIKLITDPLTYNNQITLGYKGSGFMDTGYFYCPYIPVTQIDTFTDPGDLTKRKAIMTRYGKIMIKRGENYYGSVVVTNIPDTFVRFYNGPRAGVTEPAQIGALRSFATDNAVTTSRGLVGN